MFRRLREEAPVYYNEEHDFYALSRYDDIVKGLQDVQTFSSARGDVLEFVKMGQPMPAGVFIMNDPPVHTAYRSALVRVFTPKKMAALEPKIRAFLARSLDPLVASGEFNFITHIGKDMPMRVIGMLLGVPEQDLKTVQSHADTRMTTEAGKPIDLSGTDWESEEAGQYFVQPGFKEYLDWRVDNPSDDLMTELLNVQFTDEKGITRKFTRDEILMICTIFAGAGNETTNRLIGWTGKVLAEHPDQRRKIYENRELIPQAIEEVLRYEPPGPNIARYVTEDTVIHGVKIPGGSAACLVVAAGNRDDRKFENGDQFDIRRQRSPHLTFGYGFHACIGNALARVEGRVTLDEVLNRFPEWEVDLDNAHLTCSSTVRGWETLPAYAPQAVRSRSTKPKSIEKAAAEMPATGEVWRLTVKAPTGPQEMTMKVQRDGVVFSGTVEGPMGTEAISNGEVDADTLHWIVKVRKPMALTLHFEAKVDNDTLTGRVKMGMFGSAELTGTRL
jgi:cytochrome P450